MEAWAEITRRSPRGNDGQRPEAALCSSTPGVEESSAAAAAPSSVLLPSLVMVAGKPVRSAFSMKPR
jgi:hypothetical protein